jgi:hypothetical protein
MFQMGNLLRLGILFFLSVSFFSEASRAGLGDLENLPLEIRFHIYENLTNKELEKLLLISKQLQNEVLDLLERRFLKEIRPSSSKILQSKFVFNSNGYFPQFEIDSVSRLDLDYQTGFAKNVPWPLDLGLEKNQNRFWKIRDRLLTALDKYHLLVGEDSLLSKFKIGDCYSVCHQWAPDASSRQISWEHSKVNFKVI